MDIPLIIKQIDTVLNFLAKNTIKKEGIKHDNVFAEVNSILESKSLALMDAEEFNRVIDKLKKDGYITSDPVGASMNYGIAFEGALSDQLGGYEQDFRQAHRDVEIRESQMAIQTDQAKLQRRLYYLTRILAIATGIAALYYLLEVLKYFHVLPFVWPTK